MGRADDPTKKEEKIFSADWIVDGPFSQNAMLLPNDNGPSLLAKKGRTAEPILPFPLYSVA